MPDLRARILERVDQLEATANASQGDLPWWLEPDRNGRMRQIHTHGAQILMAAADEADAAHIVTWHPQAVLTLCAGARQLAELHASTFEGSQTGRPHCSGCGGPPGTCPTLHAVARMLGIDPDGDTHA